jgi:hypothetical protein
VLALVSAAILAVSDPHGASLGVPQAQERAIEPVIIERGLVYYDRARQRLHGAGPGRRAFDGAPCATGTIATEAVNGVGRVVRAPRRVRKVQSGYLRQYASALAVGVVLLLIWFVVVRGIV